MRHSKANKVVNGAKQRAQETGWRHKSPCKTKHCSSDETAIYNELRVADVGKISTCSKLVDGGEKRFAWKYSSD